jgi:hypothetical protein
MPSPFSLLFCVNIDVCVGERGKVCIPAIYIMHSNPYSSQTFFFFQFRFYRFGNYWNPASMIFLMHDKCRRHVT